MTHLSKITQNPGVPPPWTGSVGDRKPKHRGKLPNHTAREARKLQGGPSVTTGWGWRHRATTQSPTQHCSTHLAQRLAEGRAQSLFVNKTNGGERMPIHCHCRKRHPEFCPPPTRGFSLPGPVLRVSGFKSFSEFR